MVGLLLSLGHLCRLLLLNLQPLHNLLSLLILIHHDVANTKIGDHDGGQTKHVICVFVDDGLIVSDGLVVSLQHEEDMSHVELPGLVVSTELCALSEEFLDD